MTTYIDQISALCKDAKVEITRANIESYMSKRMEEGAWVIKINDSYAAQFTLICMPGCCGAVISTNCATYPGWQRKGLGTLLNKMRQQMAWDMGYSVMLCTDRTTNDPQQRILRKNGWTRLWRFVNSRTDNDLGIELIPLQDTGIKLGFRYKK